MPQTDSDKRILAVIISLKPECLLRRKCSLNPIKDVRQEGLEHETHVPQCDTEIKSIKVSAKSLPQSSAKSMGRYSSEKKDAMNLPISNKHLDHCPPLILYTCIKPYLHPSHLKIFKQTELNMVIMETPANNAMDSIHYKRKFQDQVYTFLSSMLGTSISC